VRIPVDQAMAQTLARGLAPLQAEGRR